MKEFIKKNKFNICVMIIYSVLTFVTIVFHENWRDEAQSWLIARDLNFVDIFKQMKYEGHPCLWHLIIAPFAKLGFPYFTENIITWVIMNITAILLLKKCPFDNFIKVLILFSAPFIYYYTAISRNYCLIPLALILIAITYKNKKERPIQYILSITMLAHTHVLMLGLVGILYFMFFFEEIILKFSKKNKKEKKLIIVSLLIAIVGLLLLFMQLFGSINTNTYVEEDFNINKNKVELSINIIFNIFTKILGNEKLYLIVCFIILTILVYIYQLIIDKKTAIIALVGLSFQLFVYIFIYSDLAYQKVFTSLLLIMFFAWIQKYECSNKSKNKFPIFEIYLSFLLMFNCVLGVKSIAEEIKYEYSYAKQTGEFINTSIPNNSTFVASSIPHTSAIIPYTHKSNFWSPQLSNYFTFVTWDEKTKSSYTIKDFNEKIEKKFMNKDNIYFIYCYNWTEEGLQYFIDNTNATEIFRSGINSIQKDEKYIIYKLYSD